MPRSVGSASKLSPVGRKSTRFVRLGYVPQLKKELANYKRFWQLTQTWVTLETTLSQLRVAEARRRPKANYGCS